MEATELAAATAAAAAAAASRRVALSSGGDESARRAPLQKLSYQVSFSHLYSSPVVVLEFVCRISVSVLVPRLSCTVTESRDAYDLQGDE